MSDLWEYYDEQAAQEAHELRYRPRDAPHAQPLSARAVRDFEELEDKDSHDE